MFFHRTAEGLWGRLTDAAVCISLNMTPLSGQDVCGGKISVDWSVNSPSWCHHMEERNRNVTWHLTESVNPYQTGWSWTLGGPSTPRAGCRGASASPDPKPPGPSFLSLAPLQLPLCRAPVRQLSQPGTGRSTHVHIYYKWTGEWRKKVLCRKTAGGGIRVLEASKNISFAGLQPTVRSVRA